MPFTGSIHGYRRPGAQVARRISRPGRALCILIAGAMLMIAQNDHARAQDSQTDPKQVPTAPESTRPDQPLSEQLNQSKGVLHPPRNVDPEIQAPAPDPNPNTTPVIPPPGEPGGNPNIQPK